MEAKNEHGCAFVGCSELCSITKVTVQSHMEPYKDVAAGLILSLGKCQKQTKKRHSGFFCWRWSFRRSFQSSPNRQMTLNTLQLIFSALQRSWFSVSSLDSIGFNHHLMPSRLESSGDPTLPNHHQPVQNCLSKTRKPKRSCNRFSWHQVHFRPTPSFGSSSWSRPASTESVPTWEDGLPTVLEPWCSLLSASKSHLEISEKFWDQSAECPKKTEAIFVDFWGYLTCPVSIYRVQTESQ